MRDVEDAGSPSRTARCSGITPSYWTGISQPGEGHHPRAERDVALVERRAAQRLHARPMLTKPRQTGSAAGGAADRASGRALGGSTGGHGRSTSARRLSKRLSLRAQASRRNDGTSSTSFGTSKRLRPSSAARSGGLLGRSSSRRRRRVPRRPEAGGDHRHANLVLERLVDDGAEDDVRVLVGGARDDLGRLVDLEEPDVRPPVMLSRIPVAPSIDASSSGEETAVRAASAARFSPDAMPMPISAEPASLMIVRTSAKSRLTSPGTVIRSVIPWTPWRRTSSAIRNASTIERLLLDDLEQPVVLDHDQRVDAVAQLARSRARACSARRRPSNDERPRDDADGERPELAARARRRSARRRCRCRRPRRR